MWKRGNAVNYLRGSEMQVCWVPRSGKNAADARQYVGDVAQQSELVCGCFLHKRLRQHPTFCEVKALHEYGHANGASHRWACEQVHHSKVSLFTPQKAHGWLQEPWNAFKE